MVKKPTQCFRENGAVGSHPRLRQGEHTPRVGVAVPYQRSMQYGAGTLPGYEQSERNGVLSAPDHPLLPAILPECFRQRSDQLHGQRSLKVPLDE